MSDLHLKRRHCLPLHASNCSWVCFTIPHPNLSNFLLRTFPATSLSHLLLNYIDRSVHFNRTKTVLRSVHPLKDPALKGHINIGPPNNQMEHSGLVCPGCITVLLTSLHCSFDFVLIFLVLSISRLDAVLWKLGFMCMIFTFGLTCIALDTKISKKKTSKIVNITWNLSSYI